MTEAGIPIRYSDPTQEKESLQKVAADVVKVLTSNEEILYIALQNRTAVSIKKDCAVATSNRLLLYHPRMFGRVDFSDFQWQDVKDVRIKQGILSTELTVETLNGQIETIGGLDKDQSKRFYGVAQQLENEWREKRRVREMEEARAKAGGVYVTAPQSTPNPAPAPADDPVGKLAKAKTMLDQGLISEAEYETVKAKILASM